MVGRFEEVGVRAAEERGNGVDVVKGRHWVDGGEGGDEYDA